MATVKLNGVVIADSDKIEVVSGYVYLPHEALVKEFFKPSTLETC